jgi:hypothetical protein
MPATQSTSLTAAPQLRHQVMMVAATRPSVTGKPAGLARLQAGNGRP